MAVSLSPILTLSICLAFISLSSSGASVHKECLENPPAPKPADNAEAGHVQQLGGVEAYVTGSDDCHASVILISDVYGYGTPHLRMIADKVAAAGFYSVVPDFMNGDPLILGNNSTEWLSRHRPEEVYKNAGVSLVNAIKSKGIAKVGVAGFCWGGKVAVDMLNNIDCIQAGALLHPTYTSAEDIKKVRVPTAILGGQNDRTASPALLKQYEDILNANGVENFVKVYPNVRHGWTLRYNDTDEAAVKSATEAHNDMLNWFVKILQ